MGTRMGRERGLKPVSRRRCVASTHVDAQASHAPRGETCLVPFKRAGMRFPSTEGKWEEVVGVEEGEV